MGTELLYHQNFLNGRLGSVSSNSFSPRRNPSYGNSNPLPSRRSGPQRFRHGNRGLAPQQAPHQTATAKSRVGRGTGTRLADSKMESAVDVYAGSAFWLSPSPRALPLPSFWRKEEEMDTGLVDYSATQDLRRLLKLN